MNIALHRGKPLACIGIEQTLLCAPGEHQVELPGEIDGVSYPRTHPLTGEWRHKVCRVTREKQTPIAPGIGPARLKGVEGVAFERGILRSDIPGSEQPPDRLRAIEFFHGLSWQAHELPAAAAFSSRNHGPRAYRVADLHIGRVPFTLIVRNDIDDEPVKQEAEIGERGAHVLKQEAIRTVGTDGVTTANGQVLLAGASSPEEVTACFLACK